MAGDDVDIGKIWYPTSSLVKKRVLKVFTRCKNKELKAHTHTQIYIYIIDNWI